MAVEKAFGKLIKGGICNACSFSSSPSPFCLSLAWNPSNWLGGNWILAVWPRKAACRSLVLLSHFALMMCVCVRARLCCTGTRGEGSWDRLSLWTPGCGHRRWIIVAYYQTSPTKHVVLVCLLHCEMKLLPATLFKGIIHHLLTLMKKKEINSAELLKNGKKHKSTMKVVHATCYKLDLLKTRDHFMWVIHLKIHLCLSFTYFKFLSVLICLVAFVIMVACSVDALF